jgi:hypothetical protein
MRRVCAWCHKPLDDKPEDGTPITHGICPLCAEQALASRIAINDFLKTIDAPVLAVDGDVRVIAANTPALLAVKKERAEVEDRLGGEVIVCFHSSQPGGCGGTVHCTGCQIRRSVKHTNETGESLARVKAYQLIATPSGVKMAYFCITTEKLGSSSVLVRINDEAVKRLLTGITIVRKQYQFTCAFSENVDIEKEVRQAQQKCGAPSPLHVTCIPDKGTAVVMATIYDEGSNKKLVECVRSYLLAHGWTHSE